METDWLRALGPEGPLDRLRGGQELRPGQARMADLVDRTLERGGRLLVEAGTGTGKSFAYLLPALGRARCPEHRIVVSTWTRHLQEQLVRQDLPLLQEAFSLPTPTHLVQGRENYLCLRRTEEALEREARAGEGGGELRQLEALRRFGRDSATGLRSELGFLPDAEVWAACRAERGNCLGSRSPHYALCGWQEAKRSAREAAILVVNHALLLADLRMRRRGRGLLPPYHSLVVDEAHHLEEVAAESLGVRLSRAQVFAGLRRAELLLRESGVPDLPLPVARDRAEQLFAALALRTADGRTVELDGREAGAAGELADALFAVGSALDRLAESSRSESDARAARAQAERFHEMAHDVEAALRDQGPDVVRWCEPSREEGLLLRSAPVDPGPALRSELFAPLHAVVATSATLVVPALPGAEPGDGFDYLRGTLGLEDAVAEIVESPFDHLRQVELYLDPRLDPREEDHELLAQLVLEHVRLGRGAALVLFTSRRAMRAVAERLAVPFEEEGLRLLEQGRGRSRHELLRDFRETANAVLFGVASFWEGIDLPGDALRHVILTRLPFRVPDHPRHRRRAALWSERGLDPFVHLALPEAVLRWKQGFGRLVRRQDDRGRVTVLDRRVLRSGFGALFLRALPDCPRWLWVDGEAVPLPDEGGV